MHFKLKLKMQNFQKPKTRNHALQDSENEVK